MHMSPLHAALIGATIANDGVMPRAFMVERVIDNDRGILGVAAAPSAYRSVTPAATARTVNQMMRMTVTEGTSRRPRRKRNPILPQPPDPSPMKKFALTFLTALALLALPAHAEKLDQWIKLLPKNTVGLIAVKSAPEFVAMLI